MKTSIGEALVRLLVLTLGVALILWGLGTFALGLVGERSMAALTSVRRQGGERTDGRPGRHTYAISYTFPLPDGTLVDGYTTKIGDTVYVKVRSPQFSTPVRYLKAWPRINALEEETHLNLGQLATVLAGCFLVYAIRHAQGG